MRAAAHCAGAGSSLLRAGIESIDEELISPKVRSHVEAQLDLIASGQARRADVVAHILREFEAKFSYFARHVDQLHALLQLSFGGGPSSHGGVATSGVSSVGGEERQIHRVDTQALGQLV